MFAADTSNSVLTNQRLVKKDPTHLTQTKIMRLFLWSISGWPSVELGESENLLMKIYRKYEPLHQFVFAFGQINYLRVNWSELDFILMGHCMLTSLLCILTLVRVSLPNAKTYGKIVKKFLTSFHLIHVQYEGEFHKTTYDYINKICHYYTYYTTVTCIMGMMFFNLAPMFVNIKAGVYSKTTVYNDTPALAVYYTYPGFDPYDHFIFVTWHNYYLCFTAAVSICFIDLLLILIVFQLYGHIKILKYRMSILPRPKKQQLLKFYHCNKHFDLIVEMYDSEENEIVGKLLVEFVEYYRSIITFTNEMSNFFGPMLAFNYLFHLVSGCLLLLECTLGSLDAVVRFVPVAIIIFGQLIQVSVLFEIIDTVSGGLNDSVYDMPWESLDIRNRRTVNILLQTVQKPIRITAMGVTSVGVTTMAGILKTTFSYYMFLKSMGT